MTAEEGFAVRVLPSGVRTFYFRFTYNGKKCQINLGTFAETPSRRGEVTLKQAKAEWAKMLAAYHSGKDPRVSEEVEIDPMPLKTYATMTIEELAHDYKKFISDPDHRAATTHAEYERTIDKYIRPFFMKHKLVKLTSVKKHHALELIKEVTKNRKANGERTSGQARGVLKIARAMWNFQLKKEDSNYRNPFSHLATMPEIEPFMKNKKQQRALDETEIKQLWNLLNSPNGPGSASVARALMLVLVTGQRPGEVAGMHRDEMIGDWWQIPAHRIKTRCKARHDHRVFLSPLAKKIIGNFPAYIFPSPSPKCEGKPITEKALAQLINDETTSGDGCVTRLKWLGLSRKFTPNDLRKTARTHLSDVGCPKDIGEEIVNHSRGEVEGTYNLYEYDREKRLWLTKLSEKLEQLFDERAHLIRMTDEAYDVQELDKFSRHYVINGSREKTRH